MSQPAAKAASVLSRKEPGKGLHGQVVGHHQPVIADMAADDLLHDDAGGGRGLLGIERGVDHMRGHREGHVGEHAEGREIVPLQLLPRRLDHGQRQMAVGAGPAMARHVLDHRQDAAGE